MRTPLKFIAFDFGHTLIDERLPLETEPVALMPGVVSAVSAITIPMAVWANTRSAAEADVRRCLERAQLNRFFASVVTSVDAGVRKPSPAFFAHALAKAGVTSRDVLFVGNQLNTDILGAEAFGIETVWLSGPAYRSDDDLPCDARPTHTIETLSELPGLIAELQGIDDLPRSD